MADVKHVAKAKAKGKFRGRKVAEKKWHSIYTSKSFNSTFIGECPVVSAEDLRGRTVTVSLANLTGEIRQQGTSLKFEINEIKDGSGIADIVGYEAAPTQLKRIIRKGVERIDDSFRCRTGDNKLVVIKPFAVTRVSTNNSKVKQLRKAIHTLLQNEISRNSFENVIHGIITTKLQKSIRTSLKKLHPLAAFEIKKLQIVKEKKEEAESTGTEKKAEESKGKEQVMDKEKMEVKEGSGKEQVIEKETAKKEAESQIKEHEVIKEAEKAEESEVKAEKSAESEVKAEKSEESK